MCGIQPRGCVFTMSRCIYNDMKECRQIVFELIKHRLVTACVLVISAGLSYAQAQTQTPPTPLPPPNVGGLPPGGYPYPTPYPYGTPQPYGGYQNQPLGGQQPLGQPLGGRFRQRGATGTGQPLGQEPGLGGDIQRPLSLKEKREAEKKEKKGETGGAKAQGTEGAKASEGTPSTPKEAAQATAPAIGAVSGEGRPAAPQARGGAKGAGGGAQVVRGQAGSVTTVGTQQSFEPLMERKLEYGEVPDTGEPITLEGPMPCGEFLQALNLATNWNVVVTEEAKNVTLNFWLSEVKPKKALEILKFHDIYYEFNPETEYLLVMTKKEYLKRHFGDPNHEEFTVHYADVAYVESVLTALLSGEGRLLSDQRTGHIHVWDTADNLEYMRKIFAQIDVPLEKREFTIQHAELGDIEGVLNGLLSPTGSLVSDARTGQIVVWDSPYVLEQMQEAVAKLDVPLETRTFALKHIDVDNVMDSMEAVLSERGLIQVDPRTNTLTVTDLPTRLDKMTDLLETLDKPLETRTWVIQYADLDFIADEIESLLPKDSGRVTVNEDVHQITVSALPERLDQIDQLIKTWDVKRKQVYIEAFIVEVSNDVERQLNINWSYFGSRGKAPIFFDAGEGFKPDADRPLSIGQLPYSVPLYGELQLDSSGNITRPILQNIAGKPVVRRIAGNNLALQLDYLDKQNKLTILSSPRVTVQDGEEATFQNATRVPYVSATTFFTYATVSNINNTNRVEFLDVGTILSVLPRITDDNSILLDIAAEDSTFQDKIIVSAGQTNTVPEKTIRRAETQLRVNSGETIVLGGLRRDRASHNVSRTPLLGDLPVLGRLFRYPNRKAQNSSLLIFITPTIVDESTQPEAALLAKASDTIAAAARHEGKDLWGRWSDRISNGQNEIIVSVGQTGSIYSEGRSTSVEELRALFQKITAPATVRVVILRHPRAPDSVVNEIIDAATAANLKVRFDSSVVPLVPNLPPEPAVTPSATENTPSAEASPEQLSPKSVKKKRKSE